jgi:hypothetical protein
MCAPIDKVHLVSTAVIVSTIAFKKDSTPALSYNIAMHIASRARIPMEAEFLSDCPFFTA